MGRPPKYKNQTINVFDNSDLKEWCTYFNCDREVLINAILTAGKTPKQVESYLGLRTHKTKL